MTTDSPGVIVRPPLLYGTMLIAVVVLRWFWPMPILRDALSPWLGLVPLLLGLVIAIPGRRALQAAGTNVNPSLPTTAIVTSGPYRYSRNPLYVGLTLLYCGLTFVLNTWWGFVMHRGVVLREERYLEAKFGDAYRQYCSRVARYL
jgi:protein-S-isoprenylcysteine O-methyltransferase Ste14